jgi:hypothetical protein
MLARSSLTAWPSTTKDAFATSVAHLSELVTQREYQWWTESSPRYYSNYIFQH